MSRLLLAALAACCACRAPAPLSFGADSVADTDTGCYFISPTPSGFVAAESYRVAVAIDGVTVGQVLPGEDCAAAVARLSRVTQ